MDIEEIEIQKYRAEHPQELSADNGGEALKEWIGKHPLKSIPEFIQERLDGEDDYGILGKLLRFLGI